jgi:hypothetical protein
VSLSENGYGPTDQLTGAPTLPIATWTSIVWPAVKAAVPVVHTPETFPDAIEQVRVELLNVVEAPLGVPIRTVNVSPTVPVFSDVKQ